MQIKQGGLTTDAVITLLTEHHQDMLQHSPAESVHALDLTALQAENISFWSMWSNADLAGCGALQELDIDHAEIKSMRTAKGHLRKGVAENMLRHILLEAKKRGYRKVSLETGTQPAFLPAQRLYLKFGFQVCPPFANYQDDPYSTFMSKSL
ncbi:GNAT family N-acetyltransferase [Thalassotalea sp. 42_200_T64]|nr:GNAT family N-acetyltransferase [Thalassotalea sp. 42_200_T64]